MRGRHILAQIGAVLCRSLARFVRARGGSVASIVAITAAPLAAAMGMAVEGSNWYLLNRAMQNAADSAALAAAANNGTGASTEAQAVTAQAGFTNGVNNTTVTVTLGPITNISGLGVCVGRCYAVNIKRQIPTYLLQAVGYPATQTISATAIAKPKDINYFCLFAQTSLDFNGGSKVDLNGCDVATNGSAKCSGKSSSGTTTNASHVVAVGTIGNSQCGQIDVPSAPKTTDPYTGYAANIPDQGCGGNFNQPQSITVSVTWGATKEVCGDLTLTSNVTVNTPASSSGGTTLIIHGQLNLSGFALTTAVNSGLTIIFGCGATGHSATSPGTCGTTPAAPYPSATGTLDIAAPTSGTWSGVAMYQDPLIPSHKIDYNGSDPTWNVTGLAYFSTADMLFSGAVNKASNGVRCFTMVVDKLRINGTGYIFPNSQAECVQAGLTQITGTTGRQYLAY